MDHRHHMLLDRLLSSLEAEHAVVSPGSRNAPVISALMRTGYRLHGVADERSAAFQALGMAKGRRQAVVLSCTSGTAVLNYYPAIAEAFYARVPLLVVTADRPAGLIDQWEGQAIRQSQVFASHCRLSLDLDLEDEQQVERAIAAIGQQMEEGVRGPIHLNIPLAEPLYANDGLDPMLAHKRHLRYDSILLLDLDDHLPEQRTPQRILLLNGMEDGQLLIAQCRDAESYASLVVLSDITANQASTVDHWDALLYSGMRNHPERLEALRPDLLITTGTYVVSKGMRLFLKAYPPRAHYHISRHSEIGDPFGTGPQQIDPYVSHPGQTELQVDPGYERLWQQYALAYGRSHIGLPWVQFHEFSACRYILSRLPAVASLHLGNSMPVRYASFMAGELDDLEVFSNRGTSGIDGSLSTAVGHALISDEPVYVLLGDLSIQYDCNGLDRDVLPANLKVIVLNNQGGRIFEFIDGPDALPMRQHYQVAARKRDFESLCSHFGLEYFCARDQDRLTEGMEWLMKSGAAALLEVQTEPEVNRRFYDLFKAVQYEQSLEDH